jgi:tRNA (guanosine-2'-O-)-methyltransferase
MTPERFEKLKAVLARRQPDLTVLMEDVHKTHNIAAIIRTCDAVGVFEAHAVSEDPELRRHHMIAAGTRKWVPVHTYATLEAAVGRIREQGLHIVAAHLDEEAVDYRELDYTQPIALLLGSELWGVSPDAARLADITVRVPMHGLVESLNVSVAAALVLFEAARQREQAGLYDTQRLDQECFRQRLFEWAHPAIARRCRRQRVEYPPLTEDGDLAVNPLAGGRRTHG